MQLFELLEVLIRSVERGAELSGMKSEGLACRTATLDMLPLIDDAARVVDTLAADLNRPLLADLVFGLLTGFVIAGAQSTRDMVARRRIERRLTAVIDRALRPASGLASDRLELFLVCVGIVFTR